MIVLNSQSKYIVCAMLSMFGISAAFVIIPCLTEIIESVSQEGYDQASLAKVTIGIYTQLTFIGASLGSCLSTLMFDHFGFVMSNSIGAAYLIIFITSYFCFCGMCTVFEMKAKPED